MPITPYDLIDLSEKLDADSNYLEESADRAVVSRAYYAVYHVSKAIKEHFQLPESPAPVSGSHQRLFASLSDCSPSFCKNNHLKIKQLGYVASRILNPHRTSADYFLNQPLPPNSKHESLARAKKLISEIKGLLP